MKDSIHELIDLMKVNRTKSPWARSLTVQELSEELISEVKEFEETLTTQNKEHMKDELGDVLMDTIHLMLLCEEKGLFLSNDVVENTIAKIKRRKPFLIDGSNVTREQEWEIYSKAKEKEKAQK